MPLLIKVSEYQSVIACFTHGITGKQSRADAEEVTKKENSQTEETAVVEGWKSYTVEKKLSMIAKCDKNGSYVAKTARDCNIPRGCLQQWCIVLGYV